ncbi:MAG: site-2 protease family protein [Dehalococcoidia bacterium]
MRNFRIGTLLGIPIMVNPSWFILLVVLVFTLSQNVFPESYEGTPVTYTLMALFTALVFCASIILHELAHSVVARAYKLPVKDITLFVFGGVAQITKEATRPIAELLMAIAGPLMSLALGFAFIGLWILMGSSEDRAIDQIVFFLGATNFVVAVFNMLPAFPMDGGRVLRSLIWLVGRNYSFATQAAAWIGRVFAWAGIAIGMLAMLGVETIVAQSAFSGVWLILMGFFLEGAARQSLVQNRVRDALGRYTVRDLMQTDPPAIDPSISLGVLARGAFEINPRACYFIEQDGKLAGIISAHQVAEVPRTAWDRTTAAEAMVPRDKLVGTSVERSLVDVLMEMEQGDMTHMPVVTDGRVVGVIGRDRIVARLRDAGLIKASAA